jgi:nicotinamide-nucleotide amidase
MNAEVIAIGDEMTSGERLDTNSQWLSQRLGELGVRVRFHTTVGDELEPCVQVFRTALHRADVVVSSGGLGPTADDLTRESLARALDVELVRDEQAWQHIQELFARRRREMPPRNVVQAMVPRGGRVVANPHGTAPGIALTVPRDGQPPVLLYALPGVPAELREMWEQTVAPELSAGQGTSRRYLRHRTIKCFGVGESDLEQRLPDLVRRGRTPTVGITVSQATISLRITAEADSPEACYAAMEPTVATIRACLGDLVFGEGEEELQHAVIRRLQVHHRTLATIECGSGGILASWLSEADPSPRVFRGGIVARDEHAILTASRVSEPEEATPDSEATSAVFAMARYCRRLYQADYALALGPFPHHPPDAASPESVYYAVAGPRGIEVKSTLYAGHPDVVTARIIKTALNFLRLHVR